MEYRLLFDGSTSIACPYPYDIVGSTVCFQGKGVELHNVDDRFETCMQHAIPIMPEGLISSCESGRYSDVLRLHFCSLLFVSSVVGNDATP